MFYFKSESIYQKYLRGIPAFFHLPQLLSLLPKEHAYQDSGYPNNSINPFLFYMDLVKNWLIGGSYQEPLHQNLAF